MNTREYFESELAEHLRVAEASRDGLGGQFTAMLGAWASAIRSGGKIMLFGNGGSAGDAQHLATELTVRYSQNRSPIAAVALTTDTSTLTAAANDLGYETVFARQVEALGRPSDLALGISTSGRSANVIEALRTARRLGITAAALTGGDGGDLVGLASPILIVPSSRTSRIQEMHITFGQMLCGALEIELGLVEPAPVGKVAA